MAASLLTQTICLFVTSDTYKMVKHKVTVNFGPYMSCGILEHRTARLEGLQGK